VLTESLLAELSVAFSLRNIVNGLMMEFRKCFLYIILQNIVLLNLDKIIPGIMVTYSNILEAVLMS
jgi:hypothetical protein